MKSSLYLLLWFVGTLPVLRAQVEESSAAFGGTLLHLPLTHSLFPHPARSEGYSYHDRFYGAEQHYRDSTVAVFIPDGFRPQTEVDLIIHFHGWYNNVDSVLRQFSLCEQLTASGKQALLVVPQGPRNAPDSFGGKLEEENGFSDFVEELLESVAPYAGQRNLAPRTIILSGHSGAYRVISFILQKGGLTPHIREVYLFDALYGQTEKYTHWIEHSSGKFFLVTTEDGGTKGETENLKGDLAAWGTPFFSSSDREITVDQLRKHRLVFLSTDLGHNDVMSRRRTFELFLRSSVLADIGKE